MSRTPKTHAAKPQHEELRQGIVAVMKEHEVRGMSGQEILAVLSYTIGQMVAFMDPEKVTPEEAMDLVTRNIEAGNQDAILAAYAEVNPNRPPEDHSPEVTPEAAGTDEA